MEPANRVDRVLSAHPARVHLVVAAAAAALLAALAVMVGRSNRPTDAELDLLRWFVDLPDAVRSVGEAVMYIAEIPAVLAVVVAMFVAGMRRQAIVVLACCAVARIGYEVMKNLVSRPRPSVAAVGHPLVHGEDSFAFPSGHVTIATTLALVTVAFLLPRVAPLVGLGVAALTGLGRLTLGAHWPLDVVGGFLLGVCIAGVGLALAGRWAGWEPRAPAPSTGPPHADPSPPDPSADPPAADPPPSDEPSAAEPPPPDADD
ncbi:MAG: phosphatase PAP2 family protein [Actinomycetota bacterium]|nr:phosphatase PAP2 family protein [Actinomycetota bacterium]